MLASTLRALHRCGRTIVRSLLAVVLEFVSGNIITLDRRCDSFYIPGLLTVCLWYSLSG